MSRAAVIRRRHRVAIPGVALLVTTALGGCMGWFVQLSTSDGASLQSISCPSATICVSIGSTSSGTALVEQTTKAGGSWLSQLPGVSGPALTSVSCAAPTCVAIGASDAVLMSSDSGATWTSSTVSLTHAALTAVSCGDSLHCYATTTTNVIEATSDGGTLWTPETWQVPDVSGFQGDQQQPSSNGLQSISCTAATTCVAVGTETSEVTGPPDGTVPFPLSEYAADTVSTTDGVGWSATALYTASNTRFTAVACPTALTCIAFDASGTQYDLTSTGNQWSIAAQNVSNPVRPTGLACSDVSHCIAVGASAYRTYPTPVADTTDGGVTWHSQATADSSANLHSVACISASSCWAVGSDANGALILHTVTSGDAWPSVTGVSPSVGPPTGGTVVTVTGIHFDLGVTSVSFGGMPAPSFTVVSATELTVTSPAISLPPQSSENVDIRVNSPLGTSPAVPEDQFVYNATP